LLSSQLFPLFCKLWTGVRLRVQCFMKIDVGSDFFKDLLQINYAQHVQGKGAKLSP